MQVSARVLPAGAGWTALPVARDLVLRVGAAPDGDTVTTLAGVVRVSGTVTGTAGRRRLLITLQHPHN